MKTKSIQAFHGSRVTNSSRPRELQSNGDLEETAKSHDLMQILMVFPNVQTAFALETLEHESYDIPNVLNCLADMEGIYPKENDDRPTVAAEFIVERTVQHQKQQNQKHDDLDSVGPLYRYDFMSPASFVPSRRYKLQSMDQLMRDFPFLGARKVKVLFKANSSHYALAHQAICRAIREKAANTLEPEKARQYVELLLAVLSNQSSLECHQLTLLSEVFETVLPKRRFVFSIVTASKRKYAHITCPILREEVRFVTHESLELKEALESVITKMWARQAADKAGTSMQCSCCFEDVAMDEMVACKREGHLLCADCLASYVKAQIFGQGNLGVDPQTKETAMEVLCCHGDGCSSGFARFYLEKALDPKVLAKYDDMQAQTAIERVPGLQENMYTCQKCEISFEITPDANFFVCPMEGCGFEACRHCGKAPHPALACSEVERVAQTRARRQVEEAAAAAAETQARLRVEEAATAGMLRKCPSCKKGVIKSEGCNKMTCACRTKWCYFCGKKIPGYEHFCQAPHCRHLDPPETCGNLCPLYSDVNDDERRARQAAVAEAARIDAETISGTDTERGDQGRIPSRRKLTVDIDSILMTRKAAMWNR